MLVKSNIHHRDTEILDAILQCFDICMKQNIYN